MGVYIDVLLAVNVIMNVIILILTAWAAGVRYKRWRLFGAAMLGGVYVVSGIWPLFNWLQYAPVKLMVSVCMIIAAFGARKWSVTILLMGIFYTISFILGGAVVGWGYFWQNSSYLQSGFNLVQRIDLSSLVQGTLVGAILIALVMQRMIAKMLRKENFYRLRIVYQSRHLEVNALLDTGNSLYTMAGRTPVVLVEYQTIKIILSDALISYFNSNAADLWLANIHQCHDDEWLKRVQVIPYRGVGHGSMLLGFRPDSMSVIAANGLQGTADVVVAIYHGSLSNDGSYAALLHPAAINTIANNEEVGECA